MDDDRRKGTSRRDFCVCAGASLLAVGLSACAPDTGPRIGEGALDGTDGGTGGTGGTGAGAGSGGGTGAGGGGGTGAGGAGGSGGGHDMAGSPSPDMVGGPACMPGPVSAGSASSYAVGGTPKYYSSSGSELFVQRDSGGLYAVTATCPHQGCTVDGAASGFSCPCHGWTFDIDGNPTGSARQALVHYAVCVDASGNVTVDPSQTVPATNRA